MRQWADRSSPWRKQLRFESHEFEAMMEDYRQRAGSDAFSPGQGVDVDLVMLRAINAEADYVDLPDGILGRTIFAEDGRVRVEISRELSDAAESDMTARRRLRSTVAHECGHIACHSCLFIRDSETLHLFQEQGASHPSCSMIMCREDRVNPRYSGEWWEYQANQCMAALLLPRPLFGASVQRTLKRQSLTSIEVAIRRGLGEPTIRELAGEYDVSMTVVLFRLQALGFVPNTLQRTLNMDS